MSPAFPSRRRADQFDALVEGTLTQAPTAELAGLLALAEGLRAEPEVAPRADFAASLRERLMEAAPEALSTPATGLATGPAKGRAADAAGRLTVTHRTPSKTSRERRIGVAIAAFSIVGATAVSAVASQGSLPGDTLYPVKRLVEDARTSLTMGQDAKADVLLSQARTRLDEARRLGGESNVDTAAVEQALQDFSDTANHASTILLAQYADHGNARDITDLRTFAQQGATTLSQLVDLLPPSLDGALADATRTLLTIDHSAAQACSACGDAGITELPSTLVDLLAATPAAQTTSSVGTPPATTGKPRHAAPSSGPSQAPAGSATGPLSGVTGQLTGGTSTKPGGAPTSLGGVVSGAGGAVGGAVGGVGGALGDAGGKVGGPVGGVVSGAGGAVGGVGDAVGGVTGAVGDTLNGGGGLLNPSPSPTP